MEIFRNKYIFVTPKGETFTLPSNIREDESLTISQMYDRIDKGLPLSINVRPIKITQDETFENIIVSDDYLTDSDAYLPTSNKYIDPASERETIRGASITQDPEVKNNSTSEEME